MILVLRRLSERFWVIPALLCVAAVVAAEVLIAVDERVGRLSLPSWASAIFYRVGESGSRDILGAIATSALAVAGTTFSITMAVLALTSSSYGPRLVRNFMADRGNQAVLGSFVATFLYSLLVLRSVRAIGDPGDPEAEVFIPHLAVNGAVGLAVLNVAVLVYFIHHISDSIQVSTIARRVRSDLYASVDGLYPEHLGHGERPAPSAAVLPEDLEETGRPVEAGATGYIAEVRTDALMSVAREHDVLLVLTVHPGQYVMAASTVCRVSPPERAEELLERRIRSAVSVTDARSPHQDIEFAVQQLTELAVRALSPGVNDPYTAVNALDDLSSGLVRLASRRIPSPERFDDDHVLRVYAPRPDAVSLTSGVLDSIRWYAASAPPVMHAALSLVERVGGQTEDPRLLENLVAHVDRLSDAFRRAGNDPHDVEGFAAHAREVATSLSRSQR
ncbi:DUF2254 domain-containing protein [Georgenia sp. AZ-5]|uniref:DUF2254 domain-containing protein n=1 Tax=Georgenia sp. AZ-5 TaxID=3367526 RepID=UPI0037540B56